MKINIKILVAIMVFLVGTLMCQNVFATNGTTTKETVRMREKASTDSKPVLLLSIDKKVEIVSEDGEWYKVKYKENENTYTGYIRSDMLKVEGKNESKTTSEEKKTQNEITKNETSDTTAEETKNVDNSVNSEEVANTENTENITESSDTENTENVTESSDTENTSEPITENSKFKIKNDVNIKILPSITSSNTGAIEKDTEITISEILGKWCYIESEQKSGWVMMGKIEKQDEEQKIEEQPKEENKEQETAKEETTKQEEKKTETKKETTTKMYVSSTTINVREKASTSSKIIKQLGINTEVTVVEKVDNTWSKISIDGTQGYVATKYLSSKKTQTTSNNSTENKTATSRGSDETRTSSDSTTEKTKKSESTEKSSSSNSGTTGSDVVAYAKNFMGTKYVRGGSSPKTGFDCSGFTQYVYKHFGYSISRTSSSQRSNGTSVSKSDLQAGDIVCFSGHVGIYVGGNKFIHAENPANGVRISSLSERFYTRNYITARRIIN